MDEEIVEEIFLKDPELTLLIEEKTGIVEELATKYMRKEYRKCVMKDFVDLECLKRKKKQMSLFFECAKDAFVEMSLGYEECVSRCLSERDDRTYCFENCREVIEKVIREADLSRLTDICMAKSMGDSEEMGFLWDY